MSHAMLSSPEYRREALAGEIKDQNGKAKVAPDQKLSENDIKDMTWLIEGVQGMLPQNRSSIAAEQPAPHWAVAGRQ
ncbi:hypothetical protein ACK9YZ_29885 [Rhizobium sp. ZK1]|uniref:hypothetical protein n=1 Tax=Rhizobium sp. ZK1 TaxID=3389872 RepID=UPI0039F71623